jgi:hypothetical protein
MNDEFKNFLFTYGDFGSARSYTVTYCIVDEAIELRFPTPEPAPKPNIRLVVDNTKG